MWLVGSILHKQLLTDLFFFQLAISEPPEILHFDFGKAILDEGDYAHVGCIVTKGDMPLSISWSLHAGASNMSTLCQSLEG